MLDSAPEPAFDRVTDLAREMLGVPIVVVSLVDVDRQFFKSQTGLAASEARIMQSSLTHSYCRHVVERGELIVVEDTTTDPLLRNSPATTRIGLRSYLGLPLVVANQTLGVLCAIDRETRKWSAADIKLLRGLASCVESEIAWRISQRQTEDDLATERAEQAAINAALRASEERLQFVAKATNDVVWDWDITADVSVWNAASQTIFGFASAGSGHSRAWWEEQIHPEDRRRVVTGIRAVIDGASSGWRDEYRIRRGDGAYATIFDRGYVSRDAAGNAVRMIGAMTDMSDRAEAEEQLRFSAMLLNSVEQAVIASDAAGRIIYWNRFAETLYGWTAAEVIGRQVTGVTPAPDSCDMVTALMEKVSRGESWTGELLARDKTGREFPALVTLSSIPDAGGGFAGVVGVSADLSDRKGLEEQFRQSQKMEAVGRLAGGVAHDFNNVLTVIHGNVDLLLEELDPSSPRSDDIKEIRTAAERAAGLTRQLLAFSRKQVLQPKPLALNDVISVLAPMLRRLIGEDVELVIDSHSTGLVLADRGQIEQIIVNLAVNASDAMPKGGRLTIGVANGELDHTYTAANPPAMAGKYLVLTVTDNGTGMDATTAAKAFEPFFTTKPLGKGTGLGLSTVYGIVKQSGGYVWIYSEVGRGTTLKVYLPEISAEAAAASSAPPKPSAPGGSETILLVEDDAAIRRLGERILQKAGYTVLLASSGTEAMRIASENAGPIDLIVTDMVMPGMNGRALVERICAVRPRIKAVFMSGYTDDDIIRRGLLEPGMLFIQKPFSVSGLTRSVRESLDGKTLTGTEA